MSRPLSLASAAFVVLAGASLVPSSSAAMQTAVASVTPVASAAPAESITVAAGTRYRAGPVHRWVAGDRYRDLWTMPIRVPVLDIRTYAGGLTPTEAGGGKQTKSLRFKAASGAEYVFRLSDKFAISGPVQLRNTPVDRIVQDQVSAMHPAAGPISSLIAGANGVLHATAMLMVLGDDPALGEFRADFPGRLGMLEEYPSIPPNGSGLGGATKIIDSDELLTLLNSDARHQVDPRAFLTARLTDFLINDNDRHPGNWKWAQLGADPMGAWIPIPRDRDHAFVSYGGWLMMLARAVAPNLVTFGNTPSVAGLTKSRDFDARLLSPLSRMEWDSVTRAVQTQVTGSVIAAAGLAMPVEYQGSAPAFVARLQMRAARLPATASGYYGALADRVVVHGTDAPDRAAITRLGDGFVDVRLESNGGVAFSRRFDARETSEILIYLHGGDDMALITGHVRSSILVRVIGGNGANTLVDSSTVSGDAKPTRRYDTGSVEGVSYGPDTMFDRRPWERTTGTLAPHGRDEGTSYAPIAGLGFHRHVGMTPRFGLVRYGYGFSRRPYASMLKVEGEYAIKYGGARVALETDHRLESSPLHFTAAASMSDLEVVNYNGLGNATIDSGTTGSAGAAYFGVRQRQWQFRPAVALALGPWTDVSLGPVIQHSVTDGARSPYLAATSPYGFGTFTQAGMQLGARFAWRAARSEPKGARNRLLVELDGVHVPAAFDVRSAYQSVELRAGTSVALPIPLHPVLVVRGGGKKLFGDFPFHDAAFIGGEGTTRYMDTQRYAGDASVYATSEFRIPIARFQFVIPLRVGLLGIAEAGRVSDGGVSDGGWHTTTGEGIWFARGDGGSIASIARTTEPGRTSVRLRFGLNF